MCRCDGFRCCLVSRVVVVVLFVGGNWCVARFACCWPVFIVVVCSCSLLAVVCLWVFVWLVVRVFVCLFVCLFGCLCVCVVVWFVGLCICLFVLVRVVRARV